VNGVLLPILAGAGVHFMAVVSPGPNFLVISRTALAHSRRSAMWVTTGVTTGAALIVAAGFLGASAVFTRSEPLYRSVRLIGAAYLVYLGLKALWGVRRNTSGAVEAGRPETELDPLAAYRLGLFTIASNAKAFVYFLVFFTSVVPPSVPLMSRLILLVVMPAITFGWYSMVSAAFSGDRARTWYARARRPLEFVFGVLLIVIGAEVALTI
jgi:threonine/homoserine/homoserine lactone efflux protein